MANRQGEKAEADDEITEKANKATFRMILKRSAARGYMVWRDTQHMVDGSWPLTAAWAAEGGHDRQGLRLEIEQTARGRLRRSYCLATGSCPASGARACLMHR